MVGPPTKKKGTTVMKKLLALVLALMMASCTALALAEDSDLAYIKDKGTLAMGITLFAPMNYYDGTTLVGFDTELATAVSEKLGVKAEFIEINWDSKEIELNSKNIDCIWNGMTITDERKENMAVSAPYLLNRQAMVMKADRVADILANVDGLTVVAEAGSTGEASILGTVTYPDAAVDAKAYFAGCTYIAVDSQAKALMEVKAGTADIALIDSVAAAGMVGEGTDYADLALDMSNDFGAQEYGIAFRKGSDVCAAVDAAIAELRADGTLDAIAAKYGLTSELIK